MNSLSASNRSYNHNPKWCRLFTYKTSSPILRSNASQTSKWRFLLVMLCLLLSNCFIHNSEAKLLNRGDIDSNVNPWVTNHFLRWKEQESTTTTTTPGPITTTNGVTTTSRPITTANDVTTTSQLLTTANGVTTTPPIIEANGVTTTSPIIEANGVTTTSPIIEANGVTNTITAPTIATIEFVLTPGNPNCKDDPLVREMGFSCRTLKTVAERKGRGGCEATLLELAQSQGREITLPEGVPDITRIVDACPKTCNCCECPRLQWTN